MKQKIVLMDGATGTRLWALAEAAGYAKAPVWTYNLTHPELVAQVAAEYIAAGSTLLCSNTFAANGPEVARVPGMTVGEVVAAGVRIAKEAAAAAAKTTSGADKLLKFFFHLPNFILSWLIRTILWFDRRGMLLKSIIDLSPFHASAYLTNMASLGMNSVFHHIYDAGTVSMFLAMGKREFTPVYGRHGLEKTVRTMKLRFTVDERVCSGYVFSRAFKLFDKYLTNPELLEEPMQHKEDIK